MAEAAWKQVQRKIVRMWGGEPSWRWDQGSDGLRGKELPVSLEVKRCTRLALRGSWVTQAKAQAKEEGKPFVLVIAPHSTRAPVAVVDHFWLLQLAKAAGLVETVEKPVGSSNASRVRVIRRTKRSSLGEGFYLC